MGKAPSFSFLAQAYQHCHLNSAGSVVVILASPKTCAHSEKLISLVEKSKPVRSLYAGKCASVDLLRMPNHSSLMCNESTREGFCPRVFAAIHLLARLDLGSGLFSCLFSASMSTLGIM